MVNSHKLKLTSGNLTVAVVESPDVVRFAITGTRPLGFERSKLKRFLKPLFDGYQDDPRRVEISGAHSPMVGHIVPCGGDTWMAYEVPRGGASD